MDSSRKGEHPEFSITLGFKVLRVSTLTTSARASKAPDVCIRQKHMYTAKESYT